VRLLPPFNRNVLIYMFSDSFYYGGVAVVDAFLAVLLTAKVTEGRLDAIGFVLGYALIIRAIAEIPFAYVVEKLDYITKKRIVFLAMFTYGLTLIAMGFSTSLAHIFIGQTIIALMTALAYPIKWPTFAAAIDKGQEAIEWSTEDVLSNALPALSSVLAGFIAEFYGITITFAFFGTLLMISGIAFLFIGPIKKRTEMGTRSKRIYKNKRKTRTQIKRGFILDLLDKVWI